MNEHVAQRVFDAVVHAEIAHLLTGTPQSVFLKRQAKCHTGATKKMLTHVSQLPDLQSAIDTFLEEFNDQNSEQIPALSQRGQKDSGSRWYGL